MNAVLKPHAAAPHVVADHQARRLGPEGNPHRRDRDARSDGDPRRVREDPAAEGRADHRQPAHDDPDRRAGRDAAGARRRRALGLVQHLLDAGPRRRGAGRARHARVRLQGRVAHRLLGLHPPHLRVRRQGSEGRRPEHDPRRRRRRDAADAPRPARREGRERHRQADERRGNLSLREHQGPARRRPDLVLAQVGRDHRRHGRDDDRRAPPEGDERQGHAAVSRHQRQRFGHQVASSTTCTAAASRWSTASSAPPT